MDRRQLWNIASTTTMASSTTAHCTPFTLPSDGVLTIDSSSTLTLTSDAVYHPQCTGSSDVTLTSIDESAATDLRDPFYASTLPQCYVLAATTVIAYMLLIMLLITPRTFLAEGTIVLGRRGFTNGPSGGDGGINIGGRPWLQKVASLTVVISLTIASTDTFRVAEQQYNLGYMDATSLQDQVDNGTELKVIQVISDTFVWLAQAQTLIRLFPRQREKIIIKWTGFALIGLDTLFAILNEFVYDGPSRPRSYTDAVPALSYLFALALGLLYCAWVLYYSLTKKKYAYYHPQMPNICLIALLSIVSVLCPVVFFVLDISKPDLAGWGDYVRWVGAAAASVVVWEWVERIELLERNDRKDGILGREVFDGDEMLDVTPSSELYWPRRRFRGSGGGHGQDGGSTTGITNPWPGITGFANRYRPKGRKGNNHKAAKNQEQSSTEVGVSTSSTAAWPSRPPAAATPVSRTDTASADSTVYAVRYHPISESTPVNPSASIPTRSVSRNSTQTPNIAQTPAQIQTQFNPAHNATNEVVSAIPAVPPIPAAPTTRNASEPLSGMLRPSTGDSNPQQRNPFRKIGRMITDIRRDQGEFFRSSERREDQPLQVIVVPPPVRRRHLEEVTEDTEAEERTTSPRPLPIQRSFSESNRDSEATGSGGHDRHTLSPSTQRSGGAPET